MASSQWSDGGDIMPTESAAHETLYLVVFAHALADAYRDPPLACLRKGSNPGAPGQARRSQFTPPRPPARSRAAPGAPIHRHALESDARVTPRQGRGFKRQGLQVPRPRIPIYGKLIGQAARDGQAFLERTALNRRPSARPSWELSESSGSHPTSAGAPPRVRSGRTNAGTGPSRGHIRNQYTEH